MENKDKENNKEKDINELLEKLSNINLHQLVKAIWNTRIPFLVTTFGIFLGYTSHIYRLGAEHQINKIGIPLKAIQYGNSRYRY